MNSALIPASGAKRAAPDPIPKNFRSGKVSKIGFKDFSMNGAGSTSDSKDPATTSNLIFEKSVLKRSSIDLNLNQVRGQSFEA